jgi:hypothetical protein
VRPQIRALTAIALGIIPAPPTTTPKPIELRVPSHECSAPCDMNVTVLIPAHPDNRSASVVWSYRDNAELPVGPNAAQTQFSVKIGQFDKGDHTVYAVLVREKNGEPETYQDSQRISVR